MEIIREFSFIKDAVVSASAPSVSTFVPGDRKNVVYKSNKYMFKFELTVAGSLPAGAVLNVLFFRKDQVASVETKSFTFGALVDASATATYEVLKCDEIEFMDIGIVCATDAADYKISLTAKLFDRNVDAQALAEVSATPTNVNITTPVAPFAAGVAQAIDFELINVEAIAVETLSEVLVYSSASSTGASIDAASALAVTGGKGTLLTAIVPDAVLRLLTLPDGTFGVTLTEPAGTYYLVVVLPNGKKIVSSALVFA